MTKKEVFEDNFGDEAINRNGTGTPPGLNGFRNNNTRMIKRYTNAYMLVYIRRSQLDEVLGPVEGDNIPPHLSALLNIQDILYTPSFVFYKKKRIYNAYTLLLNNTVSIYIDHLTLLICCRKACH